MSRRGGPSRQCAICGECFEPARSDATYCSIACKQKAYRLRVTDTEVSRRHFTIRNANTFRKRIHGSKKKAHETAKSREPYFLPARGCKTRGRAVLPKLLLAGPTKSNTPVRKARGAVGGERKNSDKAGAEPIVRRDRLVPKATARLRPARPQGHGTTPA